MLKQRVQTALILFACLSAALFYFSQPYWWAFCAAIAAVAGWEWGGLLGLGAAQRWLMGVTTAAVSLLLTVLESAVLDRVVFALSLLLWVVLVPCYLRYRWSLRGLLARLLGLLVMVPAALALARLRDVGAEFLLVVAALVWVADVAAYFGGRAFGRRKLAPNISPGKSWEGVWCAALGVLIYGFAVLALALPSVPTRWGWLACALLLLGLTVLSVIGDLFESLLKRQAGLKDSSQLLPGHGGVLDRIDSLTSTLPAVALLLSLWQLIGSR